MGELVDAILDEKLRVRPVPETVHPDGEVLMGAHFKIAKFGMISPRMLYHNAVRATGLLYIGYVGRHLPSPLTN